MEGTLVKTAYSAGCYLLHKVKVVPRRAFVPFRPLYQVHAKAGITNTENGFEVVFSQPKVVVNEEILCQTKIIPLHINSRTIAIMALVASRPEDIVVAIHAAFENLPKLSNRDPSPSGRAAVVEQVDIRRGQNCWVKHLDARTSQNEIVEWYR